MKNFLESVIDIRAVDFSRANDHQKRRHIGSAITANIQWLIFLIDNDFRDLTLVDHEYFGNMRIIKDDKSYTISYSQWGYSDQAQFDSKIVIKIGDHFGMLRSLLYRLALGENVAGNLFNSFVSYFESFLNFKVTDEITFERTVEFLDVCRYNSPMYSIGISQCGRQFNYKVIR